MLSFCKSHRYPEIRVEFLLLQPVQQLKLKKIMQGETIRKEEKAKLGLAFMVNE